MEHKLDLLSTGDSLTGYEVSVEGQNIVLGDMLSAHADRSSSYRAAAGDLVVHIFSGHNHPDNATQLRLVSAAAAGVTAYTSVGRASIHKPASATSWRSHLTRRLGLSQRVWAAVRPFESQTLKDVLSSDYHQSPPVREWALELATGLMAIHSAGIYHGDVRPSNILLRASGGAWFADFGLSEDARQGFRLDNNQASTGTEVTMFSSPETLVNGKRNSAPSDIYSYGKVLKLFMRQFGSVPESDRELIYRISDECLSPDPGDRPSLSEILQLLGPSKLPPLAFPDKDSLRAAILADIDARLAHGIAPRQITYASGLAASTIDALLPELHRSKSPNLNAMEDYEVIHFLTSATFLRNRSNRLIDQISRGYGILNAVSFDAAARPSSGSPSRLADQIDDQWFDEIAKSASKDCAELELSPEESEDYLHAQLQLASETCANILDSDVFIRSDDVAAVMSASCPGITTDEVRILRDLGYLLSFPVGNTHVYPLFQFDSRSGLPRPCIKETSDNMDFNKSLWSRGIWWFLRMDALDDMAPVDWLREGRSEKTVVQSITYSIAA